MNMSFVSRDWVLSLAILLLVTSTQHSSLALGKTQNNIKTEVFLSPKLELGPGSVANKYYFDVEFPKGHIALKSLNAEIVDEAGISVPLQEIYLHHWVFESYHQPKNVSHDSQSGIVMVRNSGFCQDNVLGQYYGIGAETRGIATDIPDPFGIEVGNPTKIPYGYVERWLMNVHAIDTRGVEDRMGCIECRCDLYNVTKDANGNPLSPNYKGGLQCCTDNSQCRMIKGFQGPKRSFYLKYTVKWVNWDNLMIPLKIYIPDVTDTLSVSNKSKTPQHNCKVEYDIEACNKEPKNGSGCVDVRRTRLPMQKGGYLIYGAGHMHVGAIGSTLYGQDGRVLCTSKPKYGNGSKAGNEKGYVVGMTTCYPPPGSVKIMDGETITLEIIYSNSQMHTGLMGLFYFLVADQVPEKHL